MDEIVRYLGDLTVEKAELIEIELNVHNVDVSHAHDEGEHGNHGSSGVHTHGQNETGKWVVALVRAHRPSVH